MRYAIVVLWMLLCSVTSALAQVSISIGINLPLFPTLVQVPGYPVYYAPRLNSNFFFYDGMYWVYEGDNWYSSSWYNGPWWFVGPEYVPLFVLRIPVRYYRNPPMYFREWRSDAPPRWGHHWGHEWEQRRSGWDRWERKSVPAPAPLPVYQKKYSGDRYPRVEQQHELNSRNYRYQPRDAVVRQHYQEQAARPTSSRQETPQQRTPRQQDEQRANPPAPLQQGSPVAPRPQSPQKGEEDGRRSAPTQAPSRQRDPAVDVQKQPQAVQRERQMPGPGQESTQRGKGASQESRQEQEKVREKEREKEREQREERRQERNR
ncbi:hypothetical protein [Sulfuritalea sp.]|uniref:hypothetical protein n=1 Tax=Sulfuritalea sp. TaxID=2480090 RepID=UPI00286D9BEA|nr:hypothetical protein [Sulfuritalea sp.]